MENTLTGSVCKAQLDGYGHVFVQPVAHQPLFECPLVLSPNLLLFFWAEVCVKTCGSGVRALHDQGQFEKQAEVHPSEVMQSTDSSYHSRF